MLTARPPGVDDAVGQAAAAFRALTDDGWTVPLPGRGATAERWESLAELGSTDPALADVGPVGAPGTRRVR